MPNEMKMAELAERADVPRRTIRYYISRGLVSGPLRSGRDAVYGKEHLDRLDKIKQLQSEGLTLREIAHVLAGKEVRRAMPTPTSWWHYPVADDVVLSVRADTSPWRSREIRQALARMASELSATGKDKDDDEPGD